LPSFSQYSVLGFRLSFVFRFGILCFLGFLRHGFRIIGTIGLVVPPSTYVCICLQLIRPFPSFHLLRGVHAHPFLPLSLSISTCFIWALLFGVYRCLSRKKRTFCLVVPAVYTYTCCSLHRLFDVFAHLPVARSSCHLFTQTVCSGELNRRYQG
jgi:hypothetical protein